MRADAAALTGLWLDSCALAVEAAAVIGLRAAKVAGGGADAERELRRMVAEKTRSAFALQRALLTGQLGSDPVTATRRVVAHYRRAVHANLVRLG